MPTHKLLIVALFWLTFAIVANRLPAQARVRIPSAPGSTVSQPNPATGGFGATQPGTIPTIPGSATLGQPTFDPYATAPVPNAASTPPTLFGTTPASPYNSATPTPGWPSWTTPGSPNAYPNTGYPSTYPQQPSVMFPEGSFGNLSQCWPMNCAQQGPYLRLFQEVRLTHTWLAGGTGVQELGINETEIATSINFPNFFWSGHPLQVSPGFALTWFDGPDYDRPPAPNRFFPTDSLAPDTFYGLPARVYAAYLDFAWQPQVTAQLAADLNVNVGVYSDFEGFTSDSVRIQGTGLGVLALTPTITLKAGATYLDRVQVKLLPAGGIVWSPNPQTRWDIYFPRPKLAHYLTTLGNTDIWIYLNAEYGGGSWTIGTQSVDRRVDVNDIRVGGGLDWTHQCGLRGFVEAAYVFDRELVFAAGPIGNGNSELHLKDTYMVRGGLAY